MAVGAMVGANRDLHGKPAGLRTHALVSLGAAVVTLATIRIAGGRDPDALTRTIQGIITGCGFIGAGVILHPAHREQMVVGLTTAASVWVVACLGTSLGAGEWVLGLAGAAFTLAMLTGGVPLERIIRRAFGGEDR